MVGGIELCTNTAHHGNGEANKSPRTQMNTRTQTQTQTANVTRTRLYPQSARVKRDYFRMHLGINNCTPQHRKLRDPVNF